MKKRDKGFCLDPLYQAWPYPKLLWMSKGWLLMVPSSPLLQKLPSSTRELPPPPQEAALSHDWLTEGHRDWPLASAGPLYAIHTAEPHHPLAPPGIRLKLNSSGDHSLSQLRPAPSHFLHSFHQGSMPSTNQTHFSSLLGSVFGKPH